MSNKKAKNKKEQKSIAKKRIEKLFLLAENAALEGKLNLSNRYVELARKISMRYLVPIPPIFKRRICKHCYSYLYPSITSRVRIRNKKIVYYCSNCNKFSRIPIK